jgi:hypothetical protein
MNVFSIKILYTILTIVIMSTVIFRYELDEEDPSSGPAPLSICPKCGRLVKINGHCEYEAVFFVPSG